MAYEFCPKCGQKYEEQPGPHLVCQACGYIFFQNSKPTVSTIIVNEQNQVLLGKRAMEPSLGKWDVIGGFLELGESPELGALREAKEEAGVDIKLKDFIGIFMDTYPQGSYATLNICYSAEITGGELKPGDDIAELQWFNIEEAPKDMAYENGSVMLQAWSEHVQKL